MLLGPTLVDMAYSRQRDAVDALVAAAQKLAAKRLVINALGAVDELWDATANWERELIDAAGTLLESHWKYLDALEADEAGD